MEMVRLKISILFLYPLQLIFFLTNQLMDRFLEMRREQLESVRAVLSIIYNIPDNEVLLTQFRKYCRQTEEIIYILMQALEDLCNSKQIDNDIMDIAQHAHTKIENAVKDIQEHIKSKEALIEENNELREQLATLKRNIEEISQQQAFDSGYINTGGTIRGGDPIFYNGRWF